MKEEAEEMTGKDENSKARHTQCDFRILLDAETTKRRKSHCVSAPKTIVFR